MKGHAYYFDICVARCKNQEGSFFLCKVAVKFTVKIKGLFWLVGLEISL